MSILQWSEAAEAVSGYWKGEHPTGSMSAFSHDTRTLVAGEAFVAISDQRDGHDYIGNAQAKGAVAAIVEHEVAADLPQLVVADSIAAIGKLARRARRSSGCIVVAITGSCGKTTVRAMLSSILAEAYGKEAVLASRGNFNNLIGLPLSLLRLDHEKYAVLEAGMNRPGELTELAAIAEPDLSIVTNIGLAHRANFASAQQIAQAKSELLASTKDAGGCVINFDCQHADMLVEAAGKRRIIGFSMKGAADAQVRLEPGDGFAASLADGSKITAKLKVPGVHNEANALAAVAAAVALGVDSDAIAPGLSQFSGIPGRLQLGKLRGGGALIDDTYNASPESVKVAIAVLADRPEPNKVLILGDMLELGSASESLHREIGKLAASQGIGSILACGAMASVAAASGSGKSFETKPDLVAAAKEMAGAQTVVLVKGSRGSHMEEVVESLVA